MIHAYRTLALLCLATLVGNGITWAQQSSVEEFDSALVSEALELRNDQSHDDWKKRSYNGQPGFYRRLCQFNQVHDATLASALPATRFYHATMYTREMEYMKVDCIVAARWARTPLELQVLFSLDFVTPDERFFSVFQGATGSGRSQQVNFAESIGKLLVSVLHKGDFSLRMDDQAAIDVCIGWTPGMTHFDHSTFTIHFDLEGDRWCVSSITQREK